MNPFGNVARSWLLWLSETKQKDGWCTSDSSTVGISRFSSLPRDSLPRSETFYHLSTFCHYWSAGGIGLKFSGTDCVCITILPLWPFISFQDPISSKTCFSDYFLWLLCWLYEFFTVFLCYTTLQLLDKCSSSISEYCLFAAILFNAQSVIAAPFA